MKKTFALVCMAAAAMFMTADTASAHHGYPGFGYGYGGYGYGSGISLGYTRVSPRTSFSIGYSNVPRYGYGFGAPAYGWGAPSRSVIRSRSVYRGPVYSGRGCRW